MVSWMCVLELVKHEEVLGILGPHGSTEETFAAAVGEITHVPIVSFTATSSAISYKENDYFVRTTLDDAVQAQALAAICQRFEWPEVVIFYEDTEYGLHFLSHLIKAFQDVDIRLAYMTRIPTSADDTYILKEFNKLQTKHSRVFLVQTNPAMGSRLFALANAVGIMSEGSAWIITDSFSMFLDSIDSDTRDSMDGVVGVRPYVSASKNLASFQERWKRIVRLNMNAGPIMEPSVLGLWVYDAVTALAIAAEKITPTNSSLLDVNKSKTQRDNTALGISSFGPMLLNELSNTKFSGLAGDFELVEGKFKSSAFEIFNIIGNGEKRLGFWTPERGIVRDLNASGEPTLSNSTEELKHVMWPGDSVTQPKGWAIPATGILRVGVPWKPGYKEFVNVTIDPATNRTNAAGFSIDIFLSALEWLPFPINYEFRCYNTTHISGISNYDDMLLKMPQEFDMVVGDTTIWAPRAAYVDFSLPYAQSGLVQVISNKKPLDMWIFIKPMAWDLWLAIVVACILLGVVLCILERRVTDTGEESVRPHNKRPGTVYWTPVAILAFQERNMVSNTWSVFVLVCWLFMAFILMQSFTANLSAILTVDQLKFSLEDYNVGYQGGFSMKEFLISNLKIKESRLIPYNTVDEFHEAMSRGSRHGGIDVIFDEIPYVKLLLSRYGSQYRTVGPTYWTDGLGFAFPIGSPLVSYFSRAILNVTQSPYLNILEQKNFGPGYSSQDPVPSVISQGTSKLTFKQFVGLFSLIGSLVLFALFCSETAIGRKLTDITAHFIHDCFHSRTPQVHSVERPTADGETTQDTANIPPPGEGTGTGTDAQLITEPARVDDQQIDETGPSNEAIAAQNAGVVIENHG